MSTEKIKAETEGFWTLVFRHPYTYTCILSFVIFAGIFSWSYYSDKYLIRKMETEMSTPAVTVAELIEILKKENQTAPVQYLIVSSVDGAVLNMDLRSNLVDVQKVLGAFKKP